MSKAKKIVEKVKQGELKHAMKNVVWLFKITGKYRVNVIVYVLLAVLRLGCTLFLTVSVKDLIDYLLVEEMEQLIWTAIMFGIVGIVNILLSVMVERYGSVISYKVYQENSQEIYRIIMESDWESLSEFHSGDLLNRMSKDIDTVSKSLTGWIATLFVQTLQIIVSVIVISYYDPILLLVLILCTPLVMVCSRFFVKKLYKHNKEQRVLDSEQLMLNKESFQNMQTIKAFDLVELFEEKEKKLLSRFTFNGLKVVKYSMLSWATMYLAGQVAAGICLAFSAYHVYTGVITMGILLMIAALASYVASAFKSMISIFPKLVATVTSADRIRKLMDLPKEDYDKDLSREIFEKCEDSAVNIELENLSFSYKNGKEVFDDVDLNAASGEVVALVGPSGEGKTTMLRILLGLVKVEGSAKIHISAEKEGRNIDPSTRRLISYVPQQNMMMSGTIADNMRLVNQEATDEDIIKALKDSCAYAFVQKLEGGINYEMKESGFSFSEGQNQRLAIARALLHKAPILLLDEATSALDITTERMIIKNLEREHQKRLCILTTHRPSVLEICDHVYKISEKKVKLIKEDEIAKMIQEF